MTIKQYLLLMGVCTVLCWLGFLMVLFFINPEKAGNLGFTLFYASLFFALSGTLSALSFVFRLLFTKRYTKTEEVQISFRQAVFFALVICGALFLQAQGLMTWLNTILLVALVTVVEFVIISFKKENFGQDH